MTFLIWLMSGSVKFERKLDILQLLKNGGTDITEQVKEIDERPVPDLPFLW
jgi:hypothetical protein